MIVRDLHRGYGPYFDNLSENEQQGMKRSEEKWKRFADKYLTGFGGPPYDENERRYQSAVNPRDVEYEPNPVIHAHLHESGPLAPQRRDVTTEQLKEPPTFSIMEGGLELEDQYTGDGETLSNVSADVFRNRIASHDLPREGFPSSTSARNGPATAVVELSSFPCSECPMAFRKAYERNKHVNRKHLRRYRCPYSGCGKTFSLNANLERHMKSCHVVSAERLTCPNPWCRSPEKAFARRDNLERHIRRCQVASGAGG